MKASLFITCLSDMFFPEVGEAVVRLLRRHGVTVDFSADQTCCGQPAYNSGYVDEARTLARRFLEVFEGSEYVVCPSGSCAGMVRSYYPELFKDDPVWAGRAAAVAGRVYEFSEFLVKVVGVEDVGATFNARATYHASCHMSRELGVRDEPLRLLNHVRGLELVPMERTDLCCGFGGSFAVKLPDISRAMADEKLEHVAATRAEVLVGSDAGCLMHLGGRLQRLGQNVRTLHLAQLLWEGVSR